MCERGGHGRRPRSSVSVGCTGSRVCCCRHLPRLVWASGSEGGFDDPRVAGGNAERVPMGPTSRGLLEFGHLPALSHSPCRGGRRASRLGCGSGLLCSGYSSGGLGGGLVWRRGPWQPPPQRGAGSVGPHSAGSVGRPGLATQPRRGPRCVGPGQEASFCSALCPLLSRDWHRRLWVLPGAPLSLVVLVLLNSGAWSHGLGAKGSSV